MTHPLQDPHYQMLAKMLADERKRLGLFQADLAERLGKPQSYVSKYESGGRRLDLIEFLDVVQAMEVDPHAILDALIKSLHKDRQPR